MLKVQSLLNFNTFNFNTFNFNTFNFNTFNLLLVIPKPV